MSAFGEAYRKIYGRSVATIIGLRKPKNKDVIPNPRDNKRKRERERMETISRNILEIVQFLCFALAAMILLRVSL